MSNAPNLIQGLGTQMKWLSERQRVIAQNIANSETPGFKAREVAAPDFSAMLGGSAAGVVRPQVALTARMASLGAIQPRGAGGTVLDKDVSETKPDGNNVTLEDQLLKMGNIQADFAAATGLYRKQMSLLKTALGRSGN